MSGFKRGAFASAVIVLACGIAAVAVVIRPHAETVRVQTRADVAELAAVAAPTSVPVTTSTTVAPAAPPVTAAARPTAATTGDRVVLDRSPAEVGAEALQMITYPWQQRLAVSISFAGPRSGMRAESTMLPGNREEITVFVRSTDTPRLIAINIAHELGHLVDAVYNTDADRAEWLRDRGRPDVSWWTCNYCTDYRFGSGDFAETFAAWQAGASDYRSQVAPLPSPADMQTLAARFFR